ncbi:MAG: hypothetical protein EXR62_04795 [Chloroflexi bacterium]|nr:hypothetical protein [Chloroflexota bacterium]
MSLRPLFYLITGIALTIALCLPIFIQKVASAAPPQPPSVIFEDGTPDVIAFPLDGEHREITIRLLSRSDRPLMVRADLSQLVDQTGQIVPFRAIGPLGKDQLIDPYRSQTITLTLNANTIDLPSGIYTGTLSVYATGLTRGSAPAIQQRRFLLVIPPPQIITTELRFAWDPLEAKNVIAEILVRTPTQRQVNLQIGPLVDDHQQIVAPFFSVESTGRLQGNPQRFVLKPLPGIFPRAGVYRASAWVTYGDTPGSSQQLSITIPPHAPLQVINPQVELMPGLINTQYPLILFSDYTLPQVAVSVSPWQDASGKSYIATLTPETVGLVQGQNHLPMHLSLGQPLPPGSYTATLTLAATGLPTTRQEINLVVPARQLAISTTFLDFETELLPLWGPLFPPRAQITLWDPSAATTMQNLTIAGGTLTSNTGQPGKMSVELRSAALWQGQNLPQQQPWNSGAGELPRVSSPTVLELAPGRITLPGQYTGTVEITAPGLIHPLQVYVRVTARHFWFLALLVLLLGVVLGSFVSDWFRFAWEVNLLRARRDGAVIAAQDWLRGRRKYFLLDCADKAGSGEMPPQPLEIGYLHVTEVWQVYASQVNLADTLDHLETSLTQLYWNFSRIGSLGRTIARAVFGSVSVDSSDEELRARLQEASRLVENVRVQTQKFQGVVEYYLTILPTDRNSPEFQRLLQAGDISFALCRATALLKEGNVDEAYQYVFQADRLLPGTFKRQSPPWSQQLTGLWQKIIFYLQVVRQRLGVHLRGVPAGSSVKTTWGGSGIGPAPFMSDELLLATLIFVFLGGSIFLAWGLRLRIGPVIQTLWPWLLGVGLTGVVIAIGILSLHKFPYWRYKLTGWGAILTTTAIAGLVAYLAFGGGWMGTSDDYVRLLLAGVLTDLTKLIPEMAAGFLGEARRLTTNSTVRPT